MRKNCIQLWLTGAHGLILTLSRVTGLSWPMAHGLGQGCHESHAMAIEIVQYIKVSKVSLKTQLGGFCALLDPSLDLVETFIFPNQQ